MALVLDKLLLMSSLHETQPTIQRLLSGNEFSGKQIMLDTMSIKITSYDSKCCYTYLYLLFINLIIYDSLLEYFERIFT